MNIYKKIIKPLLFTLDPENAHDLIMNVSGLVSKYRLINNGVYFISKFSNKYLQTELFGLQFPNPFGLSAGLDKKCQAPLTWGALNFGFAEIGSITYQKQPGNPKPRLWRLPEDKSIMVNFGLNNLGVTETKNRLKYFLDKNCQRSPIGVSIACTTNINPKQTANDYLETFKKIANIADYITLNVSCPNVQNYCRLQNKEFIEDVLDKVQNFNSKYVNKPIFVKVGTDYGIEKLLETAEILVQYRVSAIIISNLLKLDRPSLISKDKNNIGGLSGKPLEERANDGIKFVYKDYGSKIKIIGVGGVFNAEDAYKKIKLGASLIQLITGLIYEGPLLINKMCKNLSKLLKKDGYANYLDAVGIGT